jgi:hypothetical protein
VVVSWKRTDRGPVGADDGTAARSDIRVDVLGWPEEEGLQVKDMGSEDDQVLPAAAVVALAPPVSRHRDADLSGLDHRLHGAEDEGVPGEMGHADDDPVVFCELDDPVGLQQAGGERLLAVDVATRFGRRLDLLDVVVGVPGAEDHDVGGLVVQHIGQGQVVASGAGIGHLLLEVVGVRVYMCDDVHVREPAEGRVQAVEPQHGLGGVLDDPDSPGSPHHPSPPMLRPPSMT